MIEESFIRLYAHDFAQFARRAEMGHDVEAGLDRRMADARAHAVIMDARKGSAHLVSLVSRLKEEATQFNGRAVAFGTDPTEAANRHKRFMLRVAEGLARPAEETPDQVSISAVRSTRRAAAA